MVCGHDGGWSGLRYTAAMLFRSKQSPRVVALALLAMGCSSSDGDGGPGLGVNEVAQVCQQGDYQPGQPRTPSWVSLVEPGSEPDQSDPNRYVYLSGHWLAMPLKPAEYPFTVREIQYELGSATDPPCSTLTPHKVQLFIGQSLVPPESPTIERSFETNVEAGRVRALIRHGVEPAITLEEGEVLFVAIEQPNGAAGFPCPVSCRPGDDVEQAGYRSAAPEPPYGWTDMTTFFEYRSNPTVPWVAMLDAPLDRDVPNIPFDAPSDGSQDSCIANIEYVDDARTKCTVNHLCGDDSYRLSCQSPTTCACAVNSEPTCPDGGELPCPVAKPEDLCELSPREAEQIAIELCGW